ncbi:hypothetical protein D3C75_1127900 [compost metagenome]
MRLALTAVMPWYAFIRLMNFFFAGLPNALFRYHRSFTTESLASEPELVKNTLLIGTGDNSISFSASSMLGTCALLVNKW